jgi:hypothetical protein
LIDVAAVSSIDIARCASASARAKDATAALWWCTADATVTATNDCNSTATGDVPVVAHVVHSVSSSGSTGAARHTSIAVARDRAERRLAAGAAATLLTVTSSTFDAVDDTRDDSASDDADDGGFVRGWTAALRLPVGFDSELSSAFVTALW